MSAREKFIVGPQRTAVEFPEEGNPTRVKGVPIWVVGLGVILYCSLAWLLIAEAGRLVFGILSGRYLQG